MQLTNSILLKGAGLLVLALLLALAQKAQAQNLFAPAIIVNDRAISNFELQQRERFLQVLRAPGDPARLARQQLIEDQLKRQETAAFGLSVPQEEIEAGLDDFASRAELSREELIEALAADGIAQETLRDFVEIGLLWRDYVRGRFLSRARPTEAEIDRALGRAGSGGIRVLLSEIIIPLTPQNAEQVQALTQRLSQITSTSAFSAEAERYSATETRTRGGRMNWISINDLPPGLRPVILELSPGEVTQPIQLPEAVALFQLRDLEEAPVTAPRFSAIDYAMYYIPGGRSADGLGRAAEVSRQVDRCDDLYGVAKSQPADALERFSQAPGEIPRDVALELAKLDEGEVSTALTRANGQTLVFLMLCGRTAEVNEDASREQVANALTQQRLNAFADSYLQQLQADAVIIEP